MQPLRIESKPAMRLVGFRAPFISGLSAHTNAGEVIGPLWGRLIPQLESIPGRDETRCCGYTWCAPEAERADPDEMLYLAGVPVGDDAEVPAGFDAIETPEATYAVFEHHGPIERFGETLGAIYGTWLPASEYRSNGRGDLEIYDERWTPDGEDSVFEVWVGVEKA